MLNVEDTLRSAETGCKVIRYTRCGLDDEAVFSHGYVVGYSSCWLLTHYIGDQLRLDGYDAIRIADLSDLYLDSDQTAFMERCVRLKKQEPVPPIGIELATTRDLLQSISHNYPLVMIQRERVAADECELGQLKLVSHEAYALRWMTPQAQWADDDEVYRFDDVTRVTFGSEYDMTVAAIANLSEWTPG